MVYHEARPYLLRKGAIARKAQNSLLSLACITAARELADTFLRVQRREVQAG